VRSYGGDIVEGAVDRVDRVPGGGFAVRLAGGRQLIARRLLVATGLRDELPDIAGVQDRWGRDVLHCPYCHGYEVRDQAVGVLGGTPESVHHALLIRQWSDDVVFFAHTDPLGAEVREQLAARGVVVVEGPVERLLTDDDQLCGVALEDGRVVRRTAVFVRPRMVPNGALLADLGCDADDAGWPIVDAFGRTSVPGVWVAGNVANPRAQVITAAGEGSSAAIAINTDLVEEEVQQAVERLRHSVHA
jgi:thioredoxin reductase